MLYSVMAAQVSFGGVVFYDDVSSLTILGSPAPVVDELATLPPYGMAVARVGTPMFSVHSPDDHIKGMSLHPFGLGQW